MYFHEIDGENCEQSRFKALISLLVNRIYMMLLDVMITADSEDNKIRENDTDGSLNWLHTGYAIGSKVVRPKTDTSHVQISGQTVKTTPPAICAENIWLTPFLTRFCFLCKRD